MTCEMNECTNSENVTKQVCEMKEHFQDRIVHIKINRNNDNEANFKEYKQKDLI